MNGKRKLEVITGIVRKPTVAVARAFIRRLKGAGARVTALLLEEGKEPPRATFLPLATVSRLAWRRGSQLGSQKVRLAGAFVSDCDRRRVLGGRRAGRGTLDEVAQPVFGRVRLRRVEMVLLRRADQGEQKFPSRQVGEGLRAVSAELPRSFRRRESCGVRGEVGSDVRSAHSQLALFRPRENPRNNNKSNPIQSEPFFFFGVWR